MYPQVSANGHTHTHTKYIQWGEIVLNTHTNRHTHTHTWYTKWEENVTCTDRHVVPWGTKPRKGLMLRWVLSVETLLLQLNGLCSGNGTSMATPKKQKNVLCTITLHHMWCDLSSPSSTHYLFLFFSLNLCCNYNICVWFDGVF